MTDLTIETVKEVLASWAGTSCSQWGHYENSELCNVRVARNLHSCKLCKRYSRLEEKEGGDGV